MLLGRLLRVPGWLLAVLPVVGIAGVPWLRQSPDRGGREIALCCLNATLRDFARFGRLYLEGGARDGVQSVPADWVAASVNPTAPHLQPGDNPASDWTFGHGCHWWIPENPQGDFLAIGVWGQFIRIDPDRDVVIVKTSADPEFDDNDHETVAACRAIARAAAGGSAVRPAPARRQWPPAPLRRFRQSGTGPDPRG